MNKKKKRLKKKKRGEREEGGINIYKNIKNGVCVCGIYMKIK